MVRRTHQRLRTESDWRRNVDQLVWEGVSRWREMVVVGVGLVLTLWHVTLVVLGLASPREAGLPIDTLAVSLVTLALELALLGAMWWHVRVTTAANTWPLAMGMVTRSWVAEETGKKRSAYYRPVVEFTYQVGGQHYTSTHFWQVTPRYDDSPTAAHAHLRAYAPGTRVVVRYHPMHPSVAVVSYGPEKRILWFCAGILVMLVVIGTGGTLTQPDVRHATWPGMVAALLIFYGLALAGLIHITRSGTATLGD